VYGTYNPPTDEEKERAICYLIKKIPQRTLREINSYIQKEGSDWAIKQHFELGLDIRNTLRNGKFDWDDVLFDNLWAELTEEAVRRATEPPTSTNSG